MSPRISEEIGQKQPDDAHSALDGVMTGDNADDWDWLGSGDQPVVRLTFVSVEEILTDFILAASMILVQPLQLHNAHHITSQLRRNAVLC